jgi:hypothetical protein
MRELLLCVCPAAPPFASLSIAWLAVGASLESKCVLFRGHVYVRKIILFRSFVTICHFSPRRWDARGSKLVAVFAVGYMFEIRHESRVEALLRRYRWDLDTQRIEFTVLPP